MACCRVQTSAVLIGDVSRSILGDRNSPSSVSVSLRNGQPFMPREVRIRSYSAELAASGGRSPGNRQVERPCPCLSAKRKSSTADLNTEDELDEDLRTGLNEVSTEALKVMLAEDDKMLEQFKEKVDYLGEYLVQEGHLDAARFMLILRGMLDHELYPQKDDLKGAYKKAFDTIAALIEDSGWVLKHEGRDVGGTEMVDDELIPPVLNTRM